MTCAALLSLSCAEPSAAAEASPPWTPAPPVYAAPPPTPLPRTPGPVYEPDPEGRPTEILRDAVSRVPDSVPLTKILTHDPIRAAVQQQIATSNYDLLVMGSRGRGAISA